MKNCIRCQTEMVEDYGLKIESVFACVAPVRLSKGQGLFSKDEGKIKIAICPNCGEISVYIDDVKKIIE